MFGGRRQRSHTVQSETSMVSRGLVTPNDVIYVRYANVAPKDIEHDPDDSSHSEVLTKGGKEP